jgi:predicted Zn-dependent peptidase
VAEEFYSRQYPNGLTLVAQRMGQYASSAMTIALPAGTALDPAGLEGAASVASEWIMRGAGSRDTRQLNDALDSLGCQHHEEAHSEHMVFSVAQLGRNLAEVLAIYGDVLRRSHLSEATFPPCRNLMEQALDSLEDEPARLCGFMIRERFYPHPLGRNPLGSKESLAGMTDAKLREHLGRILTPRRGIVAVAGNFDWAQLQQIVGEGLGDWQGEDPRTVALRPAQGGVAQVVKPTAQSQICLAYPATPMEHRQYYACRVAQMVLSGGMSARLFTEVREKRGLVYSVSARYHNLKGRAGMFVYAGSMPERAQETLEVTVGELRRLGEGVTPEELARAKVQLKSSLVMQGESTGARADALAADFYHLGRLRSLEEVAAATDAVTVGDVLEYTRAFPPSPLTGLTITPKELDFSKIA